MIILKDLLKVCPMQTRFLIQEGGYTKYISPGKINKLEISTMLMKLKPYYWKQVLKIETPMDSDLIIVTLKELDRPTKAVSEGHEEISTDKSSDDDVDGDGYDE